MGFLSGSASFERFWILGKAPRAFRPEHIEILERLAIEAAGEPAVDQPRAGFVAGEHLLDLQFDFDKNVIGKVLHCGVRIDTDSVPAAIRNAWLKIELAALTVDNPSGRPTREQRLEAREAVEARCAEEARDGRFRRMQQVSILWDLSTATAMVSGSGGSAGEQAVALLERAFEVELQRITSGSLAAALATDNEQWDALNQVAPAPFHGDDPALTWWDGHAENFDYLGNEFLLWLWWHFETQSDTIPLPDETEVTGMFARTLSLQCPRGESGKETISSESPVQLPESSLAIRSGKLPRRAGLCLVREGEQYDFAIQAETFAVSGARIRSADGSQSDNSREDRIDSLRGLSDTIDLLFTAFFARRIDKAWKKDLKQMQSWLASAEAE